MPSTEVSLIEGNLITTAKDLIMSKEAEIAQGERVVAALQKITDLSPDKLARVKGRVRFLKKLVGLMKEGFIPIPRMDFEPLKPLWGTTIVIDRLPVEAIAQVAEFQHKFDELGVVRGARRHRRRDPLLIGIIKYGGLEEHFILGWWRPDMMKPIELW